MVINNNYCCFILVRHTAKLSYFLYFIHILYIIFITLILILNFMKQTSTNNQPILFLSY